MESSELERILNKHFLVLRNMLINMRQLQRFLIGKNFDACSQLMELISSDKNTLERIEQERLHFLIVHPLPDVTHTEEVSWRQLAAYFPVIEQRRINVLISQIKEITIHIQLLSQSISRFSSVVGETMQAAFEELLSAKEYTYSKDGKNRPFQEQRALLYDNEQ